MKEIEGFIRSLPRRSCICISKAPLRPQHWSSSAPATMRSQSRSPSRGSLPLHRFHRFPACLQGRLRTAHRPRRLRTGRLAHDAAPREQGVVHAEVFISVGVIYHWATSRNCSNPFLPAWNAPRAGRARTRSLALLDLRCRAPFPVEEAERVFLKAAEMRSHYPSIIGIGLGRRTPYWFRALSRPLCPGTRGWTSPDQHAGETTGPEPSGRRSQLARSASDMRCRRFGIFICSRI